MGKSLQKEYSKNLLYLLDVNIKDIAVFRTKHLSTLSKYWRINFDYFFTSLMICDQCAGSHINNQKLIHMDKFSWNINHLQINL